MTHDFSNARRGAVGTPGRIILAPTEQIDKFPVGQERFLHLIGLDAALITDESQIWDFGPESRDLRQLGLALGRPVHGGDLVWKICRDLEDA